MHASSTNLASAGDRLPIPLMPPLERRSAVARAVLFALVALTIFYTAIDGMRAGWSDWLPGSMSRHRDAVAVAITAVAYGKWEGYASYRAVNRSLREHGLSVQEEDLVSVATKNYFDVMTDPVQFDAALKAASTLNDPAAEGMYFSQDEKGMAAFYTASFAIFGIAPSSWYWLYFMLYSVSVLAACIAFRQRLDILFFFLSVVCAHALVSHFLPMIPKQDINVVHGNRFLGILGSVAVFHLVFLIFERERPTIGKVIPALVQSVIIFFVVNARTSAYWLIIAVALFWTYLWITFWLRTRPLERRPASWPIAFLVLIFFSMYAHQQFVQDSAFRDGRAFGGHVFWHNLVTALHNNPQRTQRFGIPAEYPAFDDQVSYFSFDQEIARRGEDRMKYLVGNADWVYRTSSPELDFRWAAYDSVLKDVFVRTVVSNPEYAFNSFVIQQPLSILRIAFDTDFIRSTPVLISTGALSIALGVLLFMLRISIRPALYVPLLALTSACSMTPALVAAAAKLRTVEIFYILLLVIIIVIAILGAFTARAAFDKVRVLWPNLFRKLNTSYPAKLSGLETYSAFSFTTGLLLLWYLAGLLTETGHSKALDAGAFVLLFGGGPPLVWLAARGLERHGSGHDRMQCALAAQSLLVILIMAMVWLSPGLLDSAWYLPAWIHAVILCALISRHRTIDLIVGRAREFSTQVVQTVVPLLPALVFAEVLIFNPDMRESLARYYQSGSFMSGLVAGSILSVVSLWALRNQHVATDPKSVPFTTRLAAILSAAVAIMLLTDTRLPFDWIHYGTYLGPANAVLEGRFPMVDTISQYGVLNYLLYSTGLLFAPYRTFTVAAAVSVVANLATYVCILLLARRLWGVRWFALIFGILVIYAAAHVAPFQVNSYPNFRGMRFLPAAFIAMAIASIPGGRRFTPLSIFAYCASLLWSVEGAACAIGAYVTYLIVVDSTASARLRTLASLTLLTSGTYLALTLGTLAVTGELPRFDLYLKFVFGFVSLDNYTGANWLKAMDPHELIWLPLVLLYFGIASIAWCLVLDRRDSRPVQIDRLLSARLAAIAACGVLLLSLFVFRSLLVYLLVVAPLGLILFFSITVAVWRNSEASRFSRLAVGLPFIMTVSLSAAILCNAFKENDPAKLITHENSAIHDWMRNKSLGFALAARRLKSLEADYDTGMSFPWKPARMREGEILINRWFADKRNVLNFVSESPAILLRTQKDHRYPTAYPFSEGASTIMANHIASSQVKIEDGERMIVSNHPSELTPLETRILHHILADWDALPIDASQYATVYQLTRKSELRRADRLRLPLQFKSATESSAMSPLYSASSAGDSWEVSFWSTLPGKNSRMEWLQFDLGEAKHLSRIELVPYWPAHDAFPAQFDVLISSDGASWTRIAWEKNFAPNWSDYQTRPTSGYRIETLMNSVRWIRVEAQVPYSKSQGAFVLQIADVIAFEFEK